MSLFSLPYLLAQAAAPAQQQVADVPWHQHGGINVLLALAVIVLPFVIGFWLAKRFRMPDYGWRIGFVLFALTAGLVICARGWPPKLGIDLSGGVILVYETDQSKSNTVDLEGAAEQIRKSLETEPKLNATVNVADGKIDVELPAQNAAETARVETRLNDVALPEGLLVVDSHPVRDGKQSILYTVRNNASIDMDKMVSAIAKRVNPGGQKEVTIRRMGSDRVEVIIPRADPAEIDVIKEKISTAGALQFRILANPRVPAHARLIELAQATSGHDVVETNAEGKDEIKAQWIKVDTDKFKNLGGMVARDGKDGPEVLVITTPYDVGGGFLTRAAPSVNSENGTPSVAFSFNTRGSQMFGELTGNHRPDNSSGLSYQLGIVLDDVLKSAPNLNERITTNGQITGNFTQPEVDFLVDILNAGSLPAALSKTPVAEYNASAQLGSDTIRAGALSMIISTIAILIFMQIYYRFSGLVANLAVLMNLVLVMAVMILIKAHFTLAGLAGMVLSVGMAVDCNVLIFERMREEMERGAALRMAIRNGFSRAMATIIDSHFTTLIVGAVLFVMGSDQLRGFATTLILGLALNLFTAVYCARVLFDIAERRRWITDLRMMKIFGKTNFDFVRWMKLTTALSVAVILVGLFGAIARERGMFGSAGLFGIDFTGGSAVQVVFKEPIEIGEVRKTVSATLPDASVSSVGATDLAQRDTRFNINTSDPKIDDVENKLNGLFPGKLKTYSMDIVSVTQNAAPASIPETPKVEAAPADAKKADAKSDVAASDAGPAKPAADAMTKAVLKFPDGINYEALKGTLAAAFTKAEVANAVFDLTTPSKEFVSGSSRPETDWTVETRLPKEQLEPVLVEVQKSLTTTPIFPTSNSIGGKVAGDTKTAALYAMFVSNLIILGYVWVRFQNVVFGVAAVVALIHDVLISIGVLALSYWLAGPLGFLQVDQFKISLEVTAALLTIVGFSINDTIVIFDRIREIRGKSAEITPAMINLAVNQTLARTVLTSGTVFIVTLILYAAGGEGIHAFAFTFLIGVIAGSYSSVFIAAPLLLWLRKPMGERTGAATTARNVGKSRAASA
jgi:SecD/SecF fusion protein